VFTGALRPLQAGARLRLGDIELSVGYGQRATKAWDWPPPSATIADCLKVGNDMDLSGRFNFWRVLLHTRAITPPRGPEGLLQKVMSHSRGGWWLLMVVAALAAGVALRLSLSSPRPPAIEPAASAAPKNPALPARPATPAPPALRW
jgi:hypothetical protein